MTNYLILQLTDSIKCVAEERFVSTMSLPPFSALKIPLDIMNQCESIKMFDSEYLHIEAEERKRLSEKLISRKDLNQKDRHRISYLLTGISSEPERSRGGQSTYIDDKELASRFDQLVANLMKQESMTEKEAKKSATEKLATLEARTRGYKKEDNTVLDDSTVIKAIKRGKGSPRMPDAF